MMVDVNGAGGSGNRAGRGPGGAGAAPPIRAVLADDSPLYREGLTKLMGEHPRFELVAGVGTGEDALAACAEHKPDVLVVELCLEGLQGTELIDAVRERSPKTGVVGFTQELDPGMAWKVLQSGVDGLLLKDTTLPDLISAAVRVCEGGVYLCPGVQELLVRGAVRAGDRGGMGRWAQLSGREQQVAELLVGGATPRQIAEQLDLKVKTVDSHRYHLLQKLELRNVADLTRLAVHEGVIEP